MAPVTKSTVDLDSRVSLSSSNSNQQKIKVRVTVKNPSDEEETFAIPCVSGPGGTPKTVRWLVDETSRRYKNLYKIQVFLS